VTPKPRQSVTERRPDVCEAIFAVLTDGVERYSREIWEHCREREGWPEYPHQGQDVPLVQRVLRELEDEGRIVGRDVFPHEHKGSNMIRRYYQLKEQR